MNMGRDDLKALVKKWKDYDGIFRDVTKLAEICDGQIKKHIIEHLKNSMSEQSFNAASIRLAPINLLAKVVDKLSPVYCPAPRRIIEGPNVTKDDQDLLDWYVRKFSCDTQFMFAMQMAVLSKSSGIFPYIDSDGKPRIRVLLKNKFFPISTDTNDPLKMTGVVLFGKNGEKNEFRLVTKNYWESFDEEGVPYTVTTINEDGSETKSSFNQNDYNAVNFIYLNLSKLSLFSPPEDDMISMPLIIPVLVTDLNYCSMFQIFSIIYTMNVEDMSPIMAPNAVWKLHSSDSNHPPSIAVLKPEADINAFLTLIQSELSLWLNSKGIRPGSIGTLDKDSFASGISKMIDEMDTFELRKQLVEHAKKMEADFWNLIINHMHPVWSAREDLVNEEGVFEKRQFSKGCRVVTNFAEQVPLVNRGQVVETLDKEVKAKFTTRKRAIMALNQSMTEAEVDALIAEIDAETEANTPDALEIKKPEEEDKKEEPKDEAE